MKLLFLSIFFPILTFAEEKVPQLELDTFKYNSRVSERFELYLDALSQGYPIGSSTNNIGNGEKKNSIGEIADALEKYSNKIYEEGVKTQQAAIEEFEKSNKLLEGSTQTEFSPQGEKEKSNFDREAFLQCAQKHLPLLKQLLQFQLKQNEILALTLNNRINKVRGNGEWIEVNGVICGKYLGASGFSNRDSIDDIKLLSPFLARNNEKDLDLLFWALAAYAKTKATLPKQVQIKATQFWQMYWERLSYTALFTSNPLPSPHVFKKEYLNWISSTRIPLHKTQSGKQLEYRVAKEPLEKAINEDMQKRLSKLEVFPHE